MGAFLTPLRLERIEDTSHDERGTWRLIDPLMYRADRLNGAIICVPAGFITDLASVPRVPVTWLMVGGIGHAAAVVHDWLYSTQIFSKDIADDVLYEALRALKLPWWQCKLIYLGPHLFGQHAWELDNQKQPAEVVKLFPKQFEVRT